MSTKKAAENIIDELDSIAREVDHFEYGLPNHGTHQEEMIEAISKIIDKEVKSQIKKINKGVQQPKY